MYSTVRPLGAAATRCTWISGSRWLTTGRLKASRHAGDFHPVRDAAHPQQIDHDDVHRARLEHVAERRDAVHVFAAGHRRGQRIGDAREPWKVIVRRHVLPPVEVDVLEPPADVDRLMHAPALIDVAHQVDVRADRLAHQARALDLARRRGVARQRELHLHLPEALLHQRRRRLHHVLQRERAHQRAARIGRHALAQAAEQRGQRLVERLALDVPQRHVDALKARA